MQGEALLIHIRVLFSNRKGFGLLYNTRPLQFQQQTMGIPSSESFPSRAFLLGSAGSWKKECEQKIQITITTNFHMYQSRTHFLYYDLSGDRSELDDVLIHNIDKARTHYQDPSYGSTNFYDSKQCKENIILVLVYMHCVRIVFALPPPQRRTVYQ